MDYLLSSIIVLLLVFMNGFFVAAEFAAVKVRKTRIETLLIEQNKNAKYTLKIINNLNSYLSACQLGITLASLALGWVGEPTVAKILMPVFKFFNLSDVTVHSVSVVIGFIIISGLHIVLGELVPKTLSIINTEKIALCTALPLIIFYKATYPVIWVFNKSTDVILKIIGISQQDDHEIAHTDEEIMLLVQESYKHGLIDQTELTIVDNIFDFSEKTVKEIMTPRTDMICIFTNNSYEDVINFALNEQLTRYPVCENNKDNIIGFINVKDLFKQAVRGKEKGIDKIMREIIFVPETMSISHLLKEFQRGKDQMAIIVDEYGGTAGLITIEDILEEIVGEIRDEFDEEGESIKIIDEGNYLVDAMVAIDEVNELLEIKLETEEVDTIGGWLFSKLNLPIKLDNKIIYQDYEFTVNKCDSNRVLKVQIKKVEEQG